MATGAVGGSQIDVQGLVSQLIAAERAPRERLIMNREVEFSTKISALGALKGAFSGFQNALEPLKSAGIFDARSATSGNIEIFTASATSTAAPGSYAVEVIDLAKAHQLRSAAYAGGSTAVVGTGTLTITVGEESFSVDVDGENNTLAGIASAINTSAENTGVQATLITGIDGARLVLTSRNTGASSGITVAQSGGDGGLSALQYDPNGTMNLTQVQPAQDGRISIAGVVATSSTNVFADTIEGVTISVKAKPETPGTTVDLTVERNTSSITDSVKKFVSAYNAMYNEVSKQRSFDPNTRVAGPLFGDAMLRGIEQQVRNALNEPVEGVFGNYTTLASLGVKTRANGTLELDETKLSKALAEDPTVVSKLFGGEDGVAERMHSLMNDKLASGAEIDARNTSLTEGLKQVDKDKQALQMRLETMQARYLKEFTALDSLLSGLQSTSAYLSQQLANLPRSR